MLGIQCLVTNLGNHVWYTMLGNHACYTIWFREGIIVQRGKAGIYDKNGRIIMSKLVEKEEIGDTICDIIALLNFPGCFWVDLGGFVEDPMHDLIYQYASQNSALTLQNKETCIYFDETDNREETFNYFKSMNSADISALWFNTHNRISGFSGSGFTLARLTSVNIFYEPTTMHVDQLIKP